MAVIVPVDVGVNVGVRVGVMLPVDVGVIVTGGVWQTWISNQATQLGLAVVTTLTHWIEVKAGLKGCLVS